MPLSDLAMIPLRWQPVRNAAIQSLLLKERLQSGIAINPLGDSFRDDPYPALRELRSKDPVHRLETARAWFFTRHDDVVSLLRDPDCSADRSPLAKTIDAPWRRGSLFQAQLETSLFGLDPPDHTRLRALVAHAFTPRIVEQMRPSIEQLTDELLDEAVRRDGDRMDIVTDLAESLPLVVITKLLGVPSEDHALFRKWSNTYVVALDLAFSRDVIENADRSVAEMKAYFHDLLSSRTNTGDDLLSALVQAEEQGDRLSEDELYSFCILLLVAGHETTTNLIANGVLAMLQSGEWRRLAEEPALIETAVEEVLRFDPSTQLTSRVAMKDFERRGKQIRQGDQLILSIAGANRDPEVFSEPERLDLGREVNRHTAFGMGPHYCVGAPLARLEAQIVYSRLSQRFPGMQLVDGSPPRRRNSLSIRSLDSLPVALG